MYNTSKIVHRGRTDSITVESNGSNENVEVWVRNQMDKAGVTDAVINLTPREFLDLVYPILQEKGYILVAPLEGF